MNIALISTTTHDSLSTSQRLLNVLNILLSERGYSTRYIDASKLHIVRNLSCYASGKFNCASYDAGKYRCWAHKLSHENPEQYGGKDEMGLLYDIYDWSDIVIFGTSARWESHSAVLQNIIERMNTLQNRNVVFGEANPLRNKRCGVVVTGHNAKTQSIASHLLEVFQWLGFETNLFYQIAWQTSENLHSEVPTGSDLPALDRFLKSTEAFSQVSKFIEEITKSAF